MGWNEPEEVTPPTRSSPAAENLKSPDNSRMPNSLTVVRGMTPVRDARVSSISGPIDSFLPLPKAIS